jgi:ABC-type proline/glycine betaine transport system permease subunit
MISFVLGSVAALALGLVFVMFPKVERALDPYLTVLNAMPRLALAPLFLLWFGLGLGSKVAVGTSLAFFIVLANTVAGIRGVSQDLVTLSRSLGATPRQVFFKVTLPSAVPVIFSGLRLALIYSMLGVVGAELIAAEHGLGQVLAYLQSTFNMATVERFVEEGARVIAADFREETGRALAERFPGVVRFERCDVTRLEELRAAVDAAATHFGGLDILFSNAGHGGSAVGVEGFDAQG